MRSVRCQAVLALLGLAQRRLSIMLAKLSLFSSPKEEEHQRYTFRCENDRGILRGDGNDGSDCYVEKKDRTGCFNQV